MKYFYVLHDNRENKDCLVMLSDNRMEVIAQSAEYIIAHNLPPSRFSLFSSSFNESELLANNTSDSELASYTEELIEYRSKQNMKTRLMLEDLIREREIFKEKGGKF